MSKYDFDLDLSLNSSTGKVLDKIKKNSNVLEFGCAEGRMTRYMKEELSCNVYICEYNEESFKKASNYAVDGVCGNVLNYEWLEKFKAIKFDAILYVDVLEHLMDPLGALEKASELLADDGCIIVSIPNVTHNDILLKAITEHFDYTPTGLLDDTHVHFWGRENIIPFIEKTGLHVKRIEATYRDTGFTEQFGGIMPEDHSPYLINLLRERSCGEVYQFIITCTKTAVSNAEFVDDTLIKSRTIMGDLYFDRGNGYSAEDRQKVEAVFLESGRCLAEINLEDVSGIREVRFDPVDNQPCIIMKAVATQGEKKLKINYPKCIKRGGSILIYGNDPMMMIPVESESLPLSITTEFVILSNRFVDHLSSLVFDLNDENAETGKLLSQYRELATAKDLYILELKKDIETRNVQMTEKDLEIKRLSDDLDHYSNLFVIRVRRFCGRVLRKIKYTLGGNE